MLIGVKTTHNYWKTQIVPQIEAIMDYPHHHTILDGPKQIQSMTFLLGYSDIFETWHA